MPPTDDHQEYAEEQAHDATSLNRQSTMLASVESDSYPLFPPTNRSEEGGESTRKKQIAKFVLFTTLLTFLVIGRASVPENDVACVVDKVHDLLAGAHTAVLDSPMLTTSLLIMFSAFMDLVFLVTGLNWVLRGTSSRIIVTALLFYAIKVPVQLMWAVRTPVGYAWQDPGFPSLIVSYSQANEFYYSGYIGFLVICACEWKKNGNKLMTSIIRWGAVIATTILLVYRANYFIDIFGGAYFAHYIFKMVDECKEPFDKAFLAVQNVVKKVVTCGCE